MAKLKDVKAALKKKIADLDLMDDELSGMPEMGADMPLDGPTSPEFDLLSEKREELDQEIVKMQEGVQLLSEWEKFRDGPWSEEIKTSLQGIDQEVTDIAGGEAAPAGDLLGGPEAPDMAPSPDAPIDPAMPEAPLDPAEEAPLDDAPVDEAPVDAAPMPDAPDAPAAPIAAPMASAKSKKNGFQTPDKKGKSPSSSVKKDGSTMATQTQSKPSLKEKLAEVKSKREAIKKEAQQRVAAAWTIAKTMLPEAPAEVQKSAAANLLQNSTPVLSSMLRQTAKNAHYSKVAETFKQVHKVEMNDLLEDPSILKGEQSSIASELKGEAKAAKAVEKKADDRKDAGPQPETYSDGRGAGGGKHTEPKEMDADGAAKRPENTVNKSEGGDKVAKKVEAKTDAPKKAEAKKAEEKIACKCAEGCKCGSEKTAKCGDCKGDKKCEKCAKSDKAAAAKTADESAVMDAPPVEEVGGDPMAEAPVEEGIEPPADMPPAEEVPAEDNAAEVLSDEKKMVVEEKIEEAQEAISALEKEILEESSEGEELDYSQIFNEEEMDDKVSSLANEGDEHTAGNGEEFFAPSAAENLEASLDEPQMASMEDFFSLQGSDSDPLANLIGGIRTAADVAGTDVIPSFTGEAANEFQSESATGEGRDNENDHDGDLFAEAIENNTPEEGGFKREKQDATNELEAPKAAAKKAPAKAVAKAASTKAPAVIKKLKPVVAAEKKPMDIASALFGTDDL
jgi:hypothetical protein